MSLYIRISLALWISVFVSIIGCASRAPSLHMLDTRAGYDSPYDDAEIGIYQRAKAANSSFGKTQGPRIVKVYVYPHELPTQDYFWGGYVSLIIRRDEIEFEPPTEDSLPAPTVNNSKAKSHAQSSRARRALIRKGKVE